MVVPKRYPFSGVGDGQCPRTPRRYPTLLGFDSQTPSTLGGGRIIRVCRMSHGGECCLEAPSIKVRVKSLHL